MSNRLAGQNSPYLLQHKDNPVEWYPWGEEAFTKAAKENKPIFLSIGYAACHWCHVMAHESFEDETTAAFLNEHFVSIKVDREERTDIDSIYMSAVVSLTGQGGWPLSVFLTPEGKPFYGGTYFPPTRRYNMPSFREVLESVQRTWVGDRRGILESGEKIAEHLQKLNSSPQSASRLNQDILKQAAHTLIQSYDQQYGGWGKAPKFPQPMSLRFLLQNASQGDKEALVVSLHALKSMARGGMYDLIGGGFSRYSVDNTWLVPHFEKMLYDNALLARVYLHAYLITRDVYYRQVCQQTLDFVLRELSHPQGGFYSSLDADSEGEEGKYYLWTYDEIRGAIQDEQEFQIFIAAYGITQQGNFEGKNILQRTASDQELGEKFAQKPEAIAVLLDNLRQQLLAIRQQRVPPGTDDKVLTAWNGWMLTAFSEAARYLKRTDFLVAAQKNADFLLREMYPDGRLKRSWRKGQARHDAYLEDQTGLALGLLSLYQSDHDVRWFRAAQALTGDILAHFRDPQGGFYDTRDDHESLLLRPKDLQDNATPCGSSQTAELLLMMAAYTGDNELLEIAEETLSGVQPYLAKHPTAFANWLCAANLYFSGAQEVALIGEPASEDTQAMLDVLWGEYHPFTILAASPAPALEGAPALLNDRSMIDGKTTAYVCRNFVCRQPVNTPEGLRVELG